MPCWNWRVASSEASAPNRFITFEGGEGAGKTTQIARLAEALRDAGESAVLTREPGGTPMAERLRAILLHDEAADLSPQAQALTFYAARQDHLDKVIRPALADGAFVLCDRFHDSTRAYQGAGGAADGALLDALERHVVGPTVPGLTFLLDLSASEGLRRAALREARKDFFEAKAAAFHERLRESFLAIARNEPERVLAVDASGPIDTVAAMIAEAVEARYRLVSPL